MKKQTLRIMLLSAGLAAASFTGWSRAADDAPKPADTKAKTDAPAADAKPATARPRRNPADMLKNFRDQFEGLNLTDDQMKKIDGFLDTATTEIKGLAGKEDRESRRAAFTAFGKLNEDVQSVLTDTQKTALSAKRRTMMFDGIKTAYTKPELKLTEDQTKKITDIIDDAKKQAAALPAAAPGDNEARQKFRDLMRGTSEKLKAVLTEEQQKQIPQFGGRGGAAGRQRNRTTPAA